MENARNELLKKSIKLKENFFMMIMFKPNQNIHHIMVERSSPNETLVLGADILASTGERINLRPGQIPGYSLKMKMIKFITDCTQKMTLSPCIQSVSIRFIK